MRLRQARARDAADIARIEASSTSAAWSPAQVLASLDLQTTVAWVAETADGTVAGHLMISAVAGSAEVLILAVDPAFRRRGVGRSLLRAAHDSWPSRGVTEAWLEVRCDNAAAIALYEGLGWTRRGTRPGYYRDGTDALIMGFSP